MRVINANRRRRMQRSHSAIRCSPRDKVIVDIAQAKPIVSSRVSAELIEQYSGYLRKGRTAAVMNELR
ncbi:hypothetical protein HY642_05635 [Candidatus Woesearchaeota archaeon]|nr:hypothetical protein [Candidatus Woesearchaeota archaeon]